MQHRVFKKQIKLFEIFGMKIRSVVFFFEKLQIHEKGMNDKKTLVFS